MRFHVVTLFPEMIENAARIGVVGQAISDGRIQLTTVNPRQFTSNVHHTVDDRPFGGGDGMVMMAEPLAQSIELIKSQSSETSRVIHLSPRGALLTDKKIRQLASAGEDLILVTSRYAGVDQRFINEYVDEEISIGDYVLSGGELPALVLIDAVSRQMEGVLGNEASAHEESFAPTNQGLLEHPQYTRPREWRGRGVPEALLSGDHARIAKWKRALSLLTTLKNRIDLLGLAPSAPREDLKRTELEYAAKLNQTLSQEERSLCGLGVGNGENELLQRLMDVTPKGKKP